MCAYMTHAWLKARPLSQVVAAQPTGSLKPPPTFELQLWLRSTCTIIALCSPGGSKRALLCSNSLGPLQLAGLEAAKAVHHEATSADPSYSVPGVFAWPLGEMQFLHGLHFQLLERSRPLLVLVPLVRARDYLQYNASVAVQGFLGMQGSKRTRIWPHPHPHTHPGGPFISPDYSRRGNVSTSVRTRVTLPTGRTTK